MVFASSSPWVTIPLRILTVALLGLGVGMVAALASIGFTRMVLWANDVLLISLQSREAIDYSFFLIALTLLVPGVGGWLHGLLLKNFADGRARGPADAIRAVQTGGGSIPLRAGLGNAAAGLVALASGASVGLYGPLVHLGATLGAWLGQFSLWRRDRSVIAIGCGAAAAIATAFSAPIAGVIFAHEVLLRYFSLRAFAPITVASVTGFIIGGRFLRQEALLPITGIGPSLPNEYPLFAAIGILGAFVAWAFMVAIGRFAHLARHLPLTLIQCHILVGLLVGTVALAIPLVLGIGIESLRLTIDGSLTPGQLLIGLIAKLLVAALCLGFGFAGGVFSPALLLGALLGALCGDMAIFLPGYTPTSTALFATCGMAAVVSAVIGAPLTTILIVFELTRSYELATAVMVSVVFANLVSFRFIGRSLFDAQLREQGFDLSEGREKLLLEQHSIKSYLSDDFTQVDATDSLQTVKYRLLASRHTEAYVVAVDGRYLGTIGLLRLVTLEEGETALDRRCGSYAQVETPSLTPTTSVGEALDQVSRFRGVSTGVVDASEHLQGVVYEADVLKAYLDAVATIRREEYGLD